MYNGENMNILDTNASVPLYQQIAQIFQKMILSGDYPPGSKIPTENELCSIYGVSRVTIRKALGLLTQKGMLTSIPSKGTFVTEEKIEKPVHDGRLLSFSEMCHQQGMSPGSKTVRLDVIEATEKETNLLSLPPQEKLIILERIRYANSDPVVLERSKFPESSFSFLLDLDLTNASFYEFLQKKMGIVFTKSRRTVELAFADYSTSHHLKVSLGAPLLFIDGSISDDSNKYRHISQQFCSGRKFKLIL